MEMIILMVTADTAAEPKMDARRERMKERKNREERVMFSVIRRWLMMIREKKRCRRFLFYRASSGDWIGIPLGDWNVASRVVSGCVFSPKNLFNRSRLIRWLFTSVCLRFSPATSAMMRVRDDEVRWNFRALFRCKTFFFMGLFVDKRNSFVSGCGMDCCQGREQRDHRMPRLRRSGRPVTGGLSGVRLRSYYFRMRVKLQKKRKQKKDRWVHRLHVNVWERREEQWTND